MKLNVSIIAIVLVVVVTLLAAFYRVSTAPERIRQRLESAKAACLGGGGTWVRAGHEELCQAPAEQAKF